MPITVRVGLSAKRSENFQSEGVSIELAAELDQGLLQDPPRLQGEIAGLYRQARSALSVQQAGEAPAQPRPEGMDHASRQPVRGRTNAVVRLATDAQLRALNNLAPSAGVELDAYCRDEFGCSPDQLTVAQASGLIDAWKPTAKNAQRPAGTTGVRR